VTRAELSAALAGVEVLASKVVRAIKIYDLRPTEERRRSIEVQERAFEAGLTDFLRLLPRGSESSKARGFVEVYIRSYDDERSAFFESLLSEEAADKQHWRFLSGNLAKRRQEMVDVILSLKKEAP